MPSECPGAHLYNVLVGGIRGMKAIIFLLVIAAVGFGIYHFLIADSPAYSTYKKFADAVARGNKEEALLYASGPEILGGPEQNRYQTAGGMPVAAETGIRYTHESETKTSDGSVTIQAMQSVHFDPPGATSAMGALIAKYRQTVTLSKSSGKWMVTSFKEEFVEMRNWKGEKQ
jgi:hypothetical protein